MDFDRLLTNHGFTLARQRKHRVYKREDGKTLVVASTPSDSRRGDANKLRDLCRVLGKRKVELLARPIRSRNRTVPALEQPEQLAPQPAPQLAPVYTSAELKKLRRMEKHEKQRAARDEKMRALLQLLTNITNDGLREEIRTAPSPMLHFFWADALRHELRSYGIQSILYGAELATDDGFAYPIYFVRVGKYYCDFVGSEVRLAAQTHWDDGEFLIEIMGELKTVEDMCDFNNMYVKDQVTVEETDRGTYKLSQAAGAGQ
jgi:hypothetical protein